MREEIPENEDLIFQKQVIKVRNQMSNATRHQVRPAWVITWYLLALLAIAAWTYRLLGWVPALF